MKISFPQQNKVNVKLPIVTETVNITGLTDSDEFIIGLSDAPDAVNLSVVPKIVSDVSAQSPLLSSGGVAPIISMPAANATSNGYLTSTDWNTFNTNTGGGGGTGDASFVFAQNTPSANWTINHPLNKRPSVTVVDSASNIVEGHLTYIDNNTITITFSSGFSGSAYLN